MSSEPLLISSPSDRPVVLVTGATGAEGGSVARALLASGRWHVRAMTRRPESEAAARLADAGADIVRGDLADPSALRVPFAGVRAVYGHISGVSHFAAAYVMGRNLLAAVGASGARHFVFSSQASARFASDGALEVPRFDVMGQLEQDAYDMGLPITAVHVAFPYEDFLRRIPPRLTATGQYEVVVPQGDTPLAAVSLDDVGPVVARLFANPSAYLHSVFHIVGDEQPMGDYVDALAQASGMAIRYRHVERDAFAALLNSHAVPDAAHLAALFEYYRRFVPSRAGSLAATRSLHPGVRRFRQWMSGRLGGMQQTMAA